MGGLDADAIADGDGCKSSSETCSICLDDVFDDGMRSWAKLRCGHQFHLDCIGSAFNVKGAMQCPNCRKIEKGQWLYATNTPPLHDPFMDEWVNDEDYYSQGFTEMTFQWCPPGGLTGFPSSYDERMEVSPESYYDVGTPAASVYAELEAISAAFTHQYITYMRHPHPSSSNHGRSNNSHWSGPPPLHSEVPNSYSFPAMDSPYQNWEHPSFSLFPSSSNHVVGGGSSDHQSSIASLSERETRTNPDLQRLPSYTHPFHAGHSTAIAGTSTTSPMITPSYPSSVARARDRVQALQAYSQPSSNSSSPLQASGIIPDSRRSTDLRGSPLPSSSSDQANPGFYYFLSDRNFQTAADNHIPSSVELERDNNIWGSPFHRPGPDPGVMRSNGFFHHRHGS